MTDTLPSIAEIESLTVDYRLALQGEDDQAIQQRQEEMATYAYPALRALIAIAATLDDLYSEARDMSSKPCPPEGAALAEGIFYARERFKACYDPA